MKENILTLKQKEQLKGHWEVGDWCVEDYKIKMVKEVKPDGAVRELSDGYCSCSFLDLRDRMFPLTLWTKTVTESVEHYYQDLYKKYEYRLNLNWPDLSRVFCDFHVEGCKLCFKKFETDIQCDRAFESFWAKIREFVEKVDIKCAELKNEEVDGIKLFRR